MATASLASSVAASRLERSAKRTSKVDPAPRTAETNISPADANARLRFVVPFDLRCNEAAHERPVCDAAHALQFFTNSRTNSMQIRGAGSDLNLILVLLRAHGFAPCSSLEDRWSVCWHTGDLTSDELAQIPRLEAHQRWNKIPGTTALTVKTKLWQSLRAAQRLHGKRHFAFVPDSFVLPDELDEYVALMKAEEAKGHIWILKPSALQRGSGIFLHRPTKEQRFGWGAVGGIAPAAVTQHSGVASRYVHPPYLLGGRKFDCRLYVLVTCVHPLVAYVYDEGLTRFATLP
jgi:tubulin polyglutamylase TTLL5